MKIGTLIFMLAGWTGAQVPTGTIAGVVRDPTGSAISGARVTVTNPATQMARSETTSEQGDYSFSALAPGVYQMSVQAGSFPAMDRSASVEAGATTTANFDLRLGDVLQSITVQAISAQIRYDTHSVGGLITGAEIENLP